MRVFIVHAHPEPASFNGAMTREAVAALNEAGHEVAISDLYAMGFDPVSDRRNFLTTLDPACFRQQVEENHASLNNGFVPQLQAEMDKLDWCEVLIFQFPIWWLGLPAILKGWVDRVFAAGRAYGGGRYFERGVFRGKRAMCALTVGGLEDAYAEDGFYPPVDQLLWPVNHGIFSFAGFSVIEPFVVYGPSRITAEARADWLGRYRKCILNLDTAPTFPVPQLDPVKSFAFTSAAPWRTSHDRAHGSHDIATSRQSPSTPQG